MPLMFDTPFGQNVKSLRELAMDCPALFRQEAVTPKPLTAMFVQVDK
jgi:hypothetical protein